MSETIEFGDTKVEIREIEDGFEAVEIEDTPSLQKALDRYVRDHPNIVSISHSSDKNIELGESFAIDVNLENNNPGTSNIGTGRTDAYKDHLEPLGVKIDINCFEEWGERSWTSDADICLSITLVEAERDDN